jgi:hypothetical protein
MAAIEAIELTKRYGEPGEVVGLLGGAALLNHRRT